MKEKLYKVTIVNDCGHTFMNECIYATDKLDVLNKLTYRVELFEDMFENTFININIEEVDY